MVRRKKASMRSVRRPTLMREKNNDPMVGSWADLGLLWAIWNSRNKAIFNPAHDLDFSLEVSQSVDAALSPTSTKHGYGAVVTYIQGQIVAGFSVPLTSGLPPKFAEAEALNRALLWCQAIRFPLSSIVSDCQTLVRRFKSIPLIDRVYQASSSVSPSIEDVCANLTLDEEEQGGFEIGEEVVTECTFDGRWCLVGKFLSGRVMDLDFVQHQLAFLWKPGMGMYVK
uniref:RNase H type-1 domain-containing protein n=1 Tax=Cannabis sativa TaxID=3483 RepID=A0A803PJ46_CANSA